MGKIIFDTTTSDIIIKKYIEDKMSLKELATTYNVHPRVIKRTLIEHNIKLRNVSEANRLYFHDENIFSKIDTHEKAYWLGFITGDGNICNNILQMSLSSKDIDHLYKLKLFLKSNHPIHSYDRSCIFYKNKKNKNLGTYISNIQYSSIQISSPKIVADLAAHGLINKKTFREIIPSIDSKFYNSFILGFVDADGSWIIDCTRNHKFLHFSLIGNIKILKDIQLILMKNCHLNKTKIILNKETDGLGYLRYGGNLQVKRIYEFLYKNSPVFLDRKKYVIENFYRDQKCDI